MDSPTLISRVMPFPILGVFGDIFFFSSNFISLFCEQTVENMIRCRTLRHLIWFCTVGLCLTKRTLGLNGSRFSDGLHLHPLLTVCEQRILRRDYAYAQTRRSLRYSMMQIVPKSRVFDLICSWTHRGSI